MGLKARAATYKRLEIDGFVCEMARLVRFRARRSGLFAASKASAPAGLQDFADDRDVGLLFE